MAKPGVKIWPLEMVKLRAVVRVTRPAIHAPMSNDAISRNDLTERPGENV